jgi:hypothetical protein
MYCKNVFFRHINKIMDWTALEKEIDKVYKRGKSADGQPAYNRQCVFAIYGLRTTFPTTVY